MKYQLAWIFTKKGNLLPWLYSQRTNPSAAEQEFYARERKLQLVLLIRNDSGHIYCRIKCPVSPLPVKGEFEVPSVSTIENFLYENGWLRKQVIRSSMFQ